MHLSLLDLLACPACRKGAPLNMRAAQADGDSIQEGALICTQCNKEFPIRNGVPRFVEEGADYCGNFGDQWRRWRALQIDRLSGHHLSETRFFADSGWTRDSLKGRLVFDAGCGAGRFTDVAALAGARVIACDISAAIDACYATTRIHGEQVQCIQASLFDLPLKSAVFDDLYCMGVIQHTPDPERVMRSLPRFLRPGGRLVYNFYEEGFWRRLQIVKYALRLFTPRLSFDSVVRLSQFLVGLFFPLTQALAGIPIFRQLNHFIPIAAVHAPELTPEQQREWTLLDTVDWYGPHYELRQKHQRVKVLLEELGLDNIWSAPGLARATARPHAQGNISSAA